MERGDEISYFSRQLRLPDFSEEKLAILGSAKVLVIGMGGIGCTLADQLLRVGVRNLTLVDGDQVSYSNLSRQILYSSLDMGQPKVEVASKILGSGIPNSRVKPFHQYFVPDLAKELVPNHDLVVDCSDNFPTRYLVNDACVEYDKPFVFGGIDRDLIQWAAFNYKGGATYRCLHPEEPLGSFIRSCDDRGVLSLTPSLLGSIMARESIKVLLEDPVLDQFYFNILDTKTWDLQKIKARKINKSSNQRIKEAYGGWCNSGMIEKVDLETAIRKKALLVDVREKEEFDQFHLEEALNIPLSRFEKSVSELKGSDEIVLYCKTGQRSLSAAEILRQKGFEKVYSLGSGIEEMIPDLG